MARWRQNKVKEKEFSFNSHVFDKIIVKLINWQVNKLKSPFLGFFQTDLLHTLRKRVGKRIKKIKKKEKKKAYEMDLGRLELIQEKGKKETK